MGVLSCDVRDCPNIMCDRYNSAHGYICWECYNRLCEQPYIDIGEFFNTPVKDVDDFRKRQWASFLNAEFPNCNKNSPTYEEDNAIHSPD